MNSIREKYPLLMREIEAINYAWGWPGMLDSLEFIGNRADEYKGTKVLDEYYSFMTEMGEVMQNSPLSFTVA